MFECLQEHTFVQLDTDEVRWNTSQNTLVPTFPNVIVSTCIMSANFLVILRLLSNLTEYGDVLQTQEQPLFDIR